MGTILVIGMGIILMVVVVVMISILADIAAGLMKAGRK